MEQTKERLLIPMMHQATSCKRRCWNMRGRPITIFKKRQPPYTWAVWFTNSQVRGLYNCNTFLMKKAGYAFSQKALQSPGIMIILLKTIWVIRMVLTDEQEQAAYPVASLEDAGLEHLSLTSCKINRINIYTQDDDLFIEIYLKLPYFKS